MIVKVLNYEYLTHEEYDKLNIRPHNIYYRRNGDVIVRTSDVFSITGNESYAGVIFRKAKDKLHGPSIILVDGRDMFYSPQINAVMNRAHQNGWNKIFEKTGKKVAAILPDGTIAIEIPVVRIKKNAVSHILEKLIEKVLK